MSKISAKALFGVKLFLEPELRNYFSFVVRLRVHSTLSTHKRCVEYLVEYFLAVKKQIRIRERQKYPSIEEFVLLRRETGGVKVPCVYADLYLRLSTNSKKKLILSIAKQCLKSPIAKIFSTG